MGRIIDRRRVYGGKSLPYDAEVEYLGNISALGKSYIDTGIQLNAATDIVRLTFMIRNHSNANALFGCDKNSAISMFEAVEWKDMIRVSKTGTAFNNTINSNLNVKYTILMTPTDTIWGIWDEETETFSSYITNDHITRGSFITPVSCYLFYVHRKDGSYSTSGDADYIIYDFTIERNGVAILDYIPVRVGQVGYMYDKVSGQLFGNAGTGEFILGPDK